MNQFNFEYSTQVISPKGKLVYEYNPLYNFRTTGRDVLSKDDEGRILDKNRNVLELSDDGKYYYTDKYGIKHQSIPEILEDGMLQDMITGGTSLNEDGEDVEPIEDVLNFDLTHPVDIKCLQSYDGSTNLILNDGKNIPRLINTRFTPRENNTYERVDRKGNTDTNIYDLDEFDIDSSLFKRYNSIPKIRFQHVSQGGDLKVGNYTFYFKLADADGNETDFVGESGVVALHIGALNSPRSIRGGSLDENANKTVTFSISDIDSAYDYVTVYYVRNTGDNLVGTSNATVYKISKKYRTTCNTCTITITGLEATELLTLEDINTEHFVAKTAKTLTICLNMLFLGNVTKADVAYKELLLLSLRFFPFYERTSEEKLIGCVQYNYTDAYGKYEYYNTQNIYNFVGYWPEEMYRFGIVYVMNDNTLSPVFNVRGIRNMPEYNSEFCDNVLDDERNLRGNYTKEFVIDYDTNLINSVTLENSAGVVQFPQAVIEGEKSGNLSVYGIRMLHQNSFYLDEFGVEHERDLFDELREYNVKGYFFVRLKRIPTILALAFVTGIDKVAGIPLICEGADENGNYHYATETFLTTLGKLEGDFDDRILEIDNAPTDTMAAFCPEFELNLPYFNNFFTGDNFTVKPTTGELQISNDDRHLICTWNNSQTIPDNPLYSTCNIVGVPDFVQAVRNDNFTFRGRAGNPEDITYEYISTEEGSANLPLKENFDKKKRKKKWMKILRIGEMVLGAAALAVATYFTAGAAATFMATYGVGMYIGGASVALSAAAGAAAGTAALAVGSAAAGAMAIMDGHSRPNSFAVKSDNDDAYAHRSRVKIVRGAYSAYLGLTNTQLKPNTITNIYIPGYLNTSFVDLFNIRINDEAPYYPISERFQIGRDNCNKTLYRGDCYISNFTHRINRNFQDPDAPNNDKVVDPDSWINNWKKDKRQQSDVNRGDVNAVKLGSWITFKCYTSMNLALRDWDGSLPEEEGLTGHKRTFYPLSSMSTSGNYKVPDSTTYNAGFTVSTGNKMNYILPNVPYIKNTYQTRIMYSHPAATDSFKNGFREFDLVAYRDYPIQYGGLMKLVSWGGNLVAIFEHGISVIPVNEKALIPTDDGTQIAVGAVKVIPNTILMLTDQFGTQWAESIVCSESYIYGVDTVAKKIWRTNGAQFEIISDFKMQKFLNDNITLGERELTPIIGIRNVKSHYNANKHDIMFTYYDNLKGFEECVWNLCFNEYQNAFTTFYSWVPSYSANIDNVFFSYDRNASKWIAKLGLSNAYSSSADGIVLRNKLDDEQKSLQSINIDEWSRLGGIRYSYLDIANRYLPKDGIPEITYSIERDNFRNGRYFKIGKNDNGYYLYITERSYDYLKNKMLTSYPQIPVIQLNLSADIKIQTTSLATSSGNPQQWERYFSYNFGNYQSLLAVTFDNVLNRKEVSELINGVKLSFPKLRTDFWKHGQAGIIDIKETIKPCMWYGKQHPFEFEFVVGNTNAEYKMFDNMQLLTNNVKPESLHYQLIGDTYEFVEDKKNMYFRQEATKALYQYNGSDILYDHNVFDVNKGILPKKDVTNNYIARNSGGMTLRPEYTVSNTYKATIFPLIYMRLDTFNEVEDFYKHIVAPNNKDYPSMSGAEIVYDDSPNCYSIVNHVKFRDIKEVGRVSGNGYYVGDKWKLQIDPIQILLRNESWKNNVPPLVVNNVPDDIYARGINERDLPPELSGDKNYLLGKNNLAYSDVDLDKTDWNEIANSRGELKLLDRYMRVKIRYPGDKLVLVSAINTIYNTMANG